jgi:endonuclease-3
VLVAQVTKQVAKKRRVPGVLPPVKRSPAAVAPTLKRKLAPTPQLAAVARGPQQNRSAKAERIMALLDSLYPVPAIPLQHVDPFTLLVAVVLSAQTTDKKVNQVTPALFAVAPTPEAMACLSVADIRAIIREVGLAPQKAKALQGLSEKLVREHGSKVPSTLEQLLELPGVGRKTANVVLSQAFGQAAFPVDTHIQRLAARWGLSRGRTPDHTEQDLRRIFPEASWNRLHLQFIYFGREHCPALYHDLSTCKICGWAATKKRIADEGAGAKARAKVRAMLGRKPARKPARKPGPKAGGGRKPAKPRPRA